MSLLTDSKIAEIEARVAAEFQPKIEFANAELATCRRKFEKGYKQTYVELAHQIEVYFDSCCSTAKDIPDYEQRKQMFLIKRFKLCVYHRFSLKTYLDKENVETLHEMAILADDYALTHRRSFKPRQGGYSRPGGGSGGFGGNNCGGCGSSGSSSAQASKSGASPSSNAGNKSDSPSAGTGGSSYGGSRGRGKNAPWSSNLTCHYCKIPGHVMSNCRRKMSDESKASPDVKPEGFISSVKPANRTPVVEEITDHFDPKFDVREEYRPFVSVGSVSFVDSLSTPAPVRILRDTGATQTLLLKDTLPFDMSSATGESVIVQGVEGGFINVPLHRVNLVSDIVSGSVVVGVMETLPVKGVSMLSENDLAGGKVIAKPEVVKEPVTSAKTNMTEEETSSVIPSCVVTQARASKMAEDTRASNKTDDKEDKDGDPSTERDDKDRDPSIKIEDQSVRDQDPSISIGLNRDKDQHGGPNKDKWSFRSDEGWRNKRKTKPKRWMQSDNDHQEDRRGQDRKCHGTRGDEPHDDDGHGRKDTCDDREPRRDFCDDDRESQRDSDDQHMPIGRSDECHRMLQRQLEEAKHCEEDGQCGSHGCEDRPKPETPDWLWGLTEILDVDCQKAFDSIVDGRASVIASGNESAVRVNSFVGKLDFRSSRLSYVMLIGILWRFQYLCHGISSGVFLFPLGIIMIIFTSIPLILTEVLFEQFASAIT